MNCKAIVKFRENTNSFLKLLKRRLFVTYFIQIFVQLLWKDYLNIR